jgi:large subunit ribosomal protein L25
VTGIGDKSSATEKVIIRDLQYPPMGDLPSHVDFYRVSLDRAISITVPLEVTGTCEDLENKAGTLSQQTHQLSVECLPTNIPSKIKVDISELVVGGSLHVRDLEFPEGVTSTDNPDLAIVSINAMKEEVVEEVEEAAPELESAEPEVIGQDKDEEKPES